MATRITTVITLVVASGVTSLGQSLPAPRAPIDVLIIDSVEPPTPD